MGHWPKNGSSVVAIVAVAAEIAAEIAAEEEAEIAIVETPSLKGLKPKVKEEKAEATNAAAVAAAAEAVEVEEKAGAHKNSLLNKVFICSDRLVL